MRVILPGAVDLILPGTQVVVVRRTGRPSALEVWDDGRLVARAEDWSGWGAEDVVGNPRAKGGSK